MCVYPIDTAEFQCETIFDFEVEYHVPANQTGGPDSITVSIEVKETGMVYTPEEFFNGVKPEQRQWLLDVYESTIDETPEVFDVYALKYTNVMISNKLGKGEVVVTVTAGGETSSVTWTIYAPTKRTAKNVILMVGDGMNINMVAGARLISRGMHNGKYKKKLHMQEYPEFGLVNPAGVDSIITDSANSASTYNSGFKSSVNALGVYVDSNADEAANLDHPKVELLSEHIKANFGMAIGVISTAEIQDATPAAVYAHTRRRGDKAEITSQAINGCPECLMAVKPEVLMGGGGKYFLPEDSIDGSNMYQNYSNVGYEVTYTKDQMEAAADMESTTHLLTVSHRGNMDVWLDRNVYKENLLDEDNSPNPDAVSDVSGQPDLLDMVKSALKVLKRNENGFYLMIEAASIDKSAHPMDTHRLLADTIELDNVAGYLKDWAVEDGDETLLIVTADHGHAWDVWGTVDTDIWKAAGKTCADNADVEHLTKDVTCGNTTYKSFRDSEFNSPVRELSYARREAVGTYNRAGYPDYKDEDGDGFPDNWDVRTVVAAGASNFPDHTENFRVSPQMKRPAVFSEEVEAYVNNPEDDTDGIFQAGNLGPTGSTAVHSLCDVGIYGYGPGSERINNIQDNTYVYHIMAMALGVGSDGEVDATPKRPELEECKHTEEMCSCGDAMFAGSLIPTKTMGVCTVKEGGSVGKACLCPMTDGFVFVPKGTPTCVFKKMKYYAAIGPMNADGTVPCMLVKGTKLELA